MKTTYSIKSQVMRLAISPSGFTFDPQTGRSFTLNSTGLAVLNLLKDGVQECEIVRRMSTDYDQSPERVEAELESFLVALQKSLGIVKS